jgi:hypothetical protein
MRAVFFSINLTIIFLSLLSADNAFSQSVPVGMPVLDDYYRRAQLLGKIDSNISFTQNPLLDKRDLRTADVFDPDSLLQKNNHDFGRPHTFANGHGLIQILPLTWQQQLNSDHPYGWNDGPMIPAKGYQTLITGGFYLKLGIIDLQIKPEYVYAANLPFHGFDYQRSDQEMQAYFAYHNAIDRPERYGEAAYSRFFLGQSSIRINLGPVSLGLSSENLWWGPGINNALILTNNAAGFNHITINTVKPIHTGIGYFEAQVVAGHLNNSKYPSLLTTTTSDGTNLYAPKRDDWRYLAGLNANYHPSWFNGLTLGLIRTFNAYYDDVKTHGVGAYIPFFLPYTKKNVNNGVGDLFPRDQLTSIYGRLLLKKALAEIYLEYGWGDNLYNIDDFLQSPEHSRAYVVGFRKMVPIKDHSDQQILIGMEITQTSQHEEAKIREVGQWYTNYQLLQGHTNDGQVLGAGTGEGGNIQSLDVSWVAGLDKIGIGADRYEHDADFLNNVFSSVDNNSRSWVDLALNIHGEWAYKSFLFNTKLQCIKSLNYEWFMKDYDPNQYYIPHNTVYNIHGELGITYRF